MILTCIDTRVDPAHVLGLDLGDAVVFRGNGAGLRWDMSMSSPRSA